MKNRGLPILATLIAIVTVLIWLWLPKQREQSAPKHENSPITQQQPQAPITETRPPAVEKSEAQPSATIPASFEIVQASDPAAATPEVKPEPSPYRLVGNGGYPAKILDSNGNVVIEANPNFGIHGALASPNGQRVLVLGYPTSLVVEPATNRRIALASQPPGKDKLGFGAWHWIDDDTLLGESGDELVDRKPGAEGEGNNVAQTRLYLFRISNQELSEVPLPKDLGAKVFSIAQVNPDGRIRLVHEDPNATRPPELGWFTLHPK